MRPAAPAAARLARALCSAALPQNSTHPWPIHRKELAAVAIKQEDLDLIIRELGASSPPTSNALYSYSHHCYLDVSKDKAELVLRQQKGDVVQALRTLLAQ